MSEGLFASLYARREPFALIDTRERRSFVDGQWFGSINIPLSVLTRQITRLVPDRAFPNSSAGLAGRRKPGGC